MNDLETFVKIVKGKERECDAINKILDILIEFDLDTAERLLTYVSSKIELDWYDDRE